MRNRLVTRCAMMALTFALSLPAIAAAQAPQNPMSDHTRMMYKGLRLWLMGSAENMPEQHYGFKPTPEVRTFGEIVGHVADLHYRYCSIALGETDPKRNLEKTKQTKAEIVAALADALTYCDRAYNGMTDTRGMEMLPVGPGMPRIGVLSVNNLHSSLHYGNLITYMRIKNVLPPSSDPSFMSKLPR